MLHFQIEDTSSLWNWVDETLLPGLYDVTWYNGRPFEYKEGFISNKKTFLIGMPRLRQLRLKPSKIKSEYFCKKPSTFTCQNIYLKGIIGDFEYV